MMTTNPNLGDNYSELEVSARYRCSACQLVEAVTFAVPRGQIIPYPEPPAGWKRVGREFFCPNHALLFLVDGVPKEMIL
jgi:hypothetical protein